MKKVIELQRVGVLDDSARVKAVRSLLHKRPRVAVWVGVVGGSEGPSAPSTLGDRLAKPD